MLQDLESVEAEAGSPSETLFVKNTLYPKQKIRFQHAHTHDQFRQRLEETLPWLKNFPLKNHNLVMAGGCVSALLHQKQPQHGIAFSDVDLFFVIPPNPTPTNNNKASSAAAVKEDYDAVEPRVAATLNSLGEHLYREWCIKTTEEEEEGKTKEADKEDGKKNAKPNHKMRVFRNLNAVTFYHPQFPPVQVMLTIYRTPESVLSGFDLGSCSYLFDGTTVSMSERGRHTWITGVNVLTLDRRKQNLEKRLSTYFRRGFSLQLPLLSIKKTFQLLRKKATKGKKCNYLQFHQLIALHCDLVVIDKDGPNYGDEHIEVGELIFQQTNVDEDHDNVAAATYCSGSFSSFKYDPRAYDYKNLQLLQQLNSGGGDPAVLKKYLMAHTDFVPGTTQVLHFPLTVPIWLLETNLCDAIRYYSVYFKTLSTLFQDTAVAKRFVNSKLECEISGINFSNAEKEEYLEELKAVYCSEKMETLKALDFQVLNSNDFYPLAPMADKDWYHLKCVLTS